jgi:hypothetical protein
VHLLVTVITYRIGQLVNTLHLATASLDRHIQGDIGGKVNILGDDTIGHCEKKSSYEHVSNSEWLRRYSCLNLQT